jgi:hypothetical protein
MVKETMNDDGDRFAAILHVHASAMMTMPSWIVEGVVHSS